MSKVRKSRQHKDLVTRAGFESQSTKVTSDSLINNRAKERIMSEAESFHMGLFMKNLIERKHQALNTTTAAGASVNMSNGFLTSRGGEFTSTNNDQLMMN